MSDVDEPHQQRLKEIFLGLVEVMDAFDRLDRAAADAPPGEEARRWIGRFQMIRKRVDHILVGQRVQRVGYDTFQEELHEVVDVVATADRPPRTILEVQEPCYVWFPDEVVMRALRKARVVVAVPPAPAAKE